MRLIHDTAAEEWHIQRRSWEARHPCEPEPPDEEPPPRSPHQPHCNRSLTYETVVRVLLRVAWPPPFRQPR